MGKALGGKNFMVASFTSVTRRRHDARALAVHIKSRKMSQDRTVDLKNDCNRYVTVPRKRQFAREFMCTDHAQQ